jgi:hypothetical protein
MPQLGDAMKNRLQKGRLAQLYVENVKMDSAGMIQVSVVRD